VAPQGFTFRAGPAECNLLQAANTFWAALTPDQKALTLQAIQRDPSLWPGTVKILEPLTFGSLRIDSGTVLTVKEVNGNEVNLIHPGVRGNLVVSAQNTDLFARVRELVATPLNERPGRMADLLKAATIDVDGKPVALQPAHYYVIYFAGSTCPRCKIFTPQLVEHFNKTLANRKDVAFVTWPSDQATSLMLTYARKNMIPWPTVPLEKIDVLSKEEEMLSRNGVINLPGILVVDRFGSPLLATSKLNGQPLDAANAALAQLDTVLKDGSIKPGN
jgi:hypothetical protein